MKKPNLWFYSHLTTCFLSVLVLSLTPIVFNYVLGDFPDDADMLNNAKRNLEFSKQHEFRKLASLGQNSDFFLIAKIFSLKVDWSYREHRYIISHSLSLLVCRVPAPVQDCRVFDCAVCDRQLVEPRVLPCLHTFCTRCLVPLAKPIYRGPNSQSQGKHFCIFQNNLLIRI